MKLIIAGSRHLHVGIKELTEIIERIFLCGVSTVTEVVSGCGTGIDTNGEMFALANNIKVVTFPANWEKYGGYAGPRRNLQMA